MEKRCKGCWEPLFIDPNVTNSRLREWCSESCKQKSLRDRRWVEIDRLLRTGGNAGRLEVLKMIQPQVETASRRLGLLEARRVAVEEEDQGL